jgi:hypothetical protein
MGGFDDADAARGDAFFGATGRVGTNAGGGRVNGSECGRAATAGGAAGEGLGGAGDGPVAVGVVEGAV